MPERRIDLWIYSVPVLLGMHAALAAALQSRPGLPAVLLWLLGPPAITLGAIGVLLYALLQSYRRRSTWSGWRIAGFLGLGAVAALPLAYRVYPSSRDDRPSAIRFRLPLDGPITVAWGGATRSENYHVIAPDQRWAYDLLVTKNGKTHTGSGQRLTDYYAYGLPILAPAAGIVRLAFDGDPDMPPGQLGGGTDPCGNQVVLEVARDEFLFICHIQAGSMRVRIGQSVAMDEAIGRVGNSGNTSEPHVHLHLQTTSEPILGEGIPMYFHAYRIDACVVERGMPRGGTGTGEVVEHVPTRTDALDCATRDDGGFDVSRKVDINDEVRRASAHKSVSASHYSWGPLPTHARSVTRLHGPRFCKRPNKQERVNEELEPARLYCTRCGTPATRTYVQAIDDNDTCPACGGGCWRPADAPPVVKYQLTAADSDWLRSIRVQADSD